MQRYAACIEYCGSNYNGWQRQKNAPSVQQCVEQAIAQVANHSVSITAAGRTDSGVHAIAQMIHFDSASKRDAINWLRGINTALPKDIALIWIHPVGSDFHARFGVKQRRYRYVLLNREVAPAYLHGIVTWHQAALDLEKMRMATASLLGKHDFSAFRAAACQSRDPVKTITRIEVHQKGEWFWVDVEADGFLHHMVRNMVGVLCKIGAGEAPVSWAAEVLAGKDRKQGGVTFPPNGLYFVAARYDQKFGLPRPPPTCRFW